MGLDNGYLNVELSVGQCLMSLTAAAKLRLVMGRNADCQKKQEEPNYQRAPVTGYEVHLVARGLSSLVQLYDNLRYFT